MKRIYFFMTCLLLSGCAATPTAPGPQPLLFEMQAQEGQAITGLDSLKVYSPNQPAKRSSGWAEVAMHILGVLEPTGRLLAGGLAVGEIIKASQWNPRGTEQPAPLVVNQPPPLVVNQPVPLVVNQPPPIIVGPQ